MFKVGKLTDYGVIILQHLVMASFGELRPSSARGIASACGLPLPTVSKLLKLMAKHGLINAKRGAFGGYELKRSDHEISLLRLIEIFEGPPAITACLNTPPHSCQIGSICPQSRNWRVVQDRIAKVLCEISLAELIDLNEPPPHASLIGV